MIDKFGLTPQEYKCAYLVSQGYTNEEICTELKIEHCTFKTHLFNIYQKLNLSYSNIDRGTMRVRVALLFQNYDSQHWKGKYKELDEKFTEVLRLSKENADANEYCIEGLEKIVENYGSAIYKIQEIINEVGNTNILTFPDFDLKQNAKMIMGQYNSYLTEILEVINELKAKNEQA